MTTVLQRHSFDDVYDSFVFQLDWMVLSSKYCLKQTNRQTSGKTRETLCVCLFSTGHGLDG